MSSTYVKKFGINFITCVTCGYRYETATGNLDSEDELFALAEELHDDFERKPCRYRKLIIEISDMRYEQKEVKKGGNES